MMSGTPSDPNRTSTSHTLALEDSLPTAQAQLHPAHARLHQLSLVTPAGKILEQATTTETETPTLVPQQAANVIDMTIETMAVAQTNMSEMKIAATVVDLNNSEVIQDKVQEEALEIHKSR